MQNVLLSITFDFITNFIMKGGDALPYCIVLDRDLLAVYLAFIGGNI